MSWVFNNWKLVAILVFVIIVAFLVPEVFGDLFKAIKDVGTGVADTGKGLGQGIKIK